MPTSWCGVGGRQTPKKSPTRSPFLEWDGVGWGPMGVYPGEPKGIPWEGTRGAPTGTQIK